MIFFSKLLKLYINSSIHVALAVASFACITYLDFELEFKNHLIAFIFFSTIVAYTFVKYIPLMKFDQLRINTNLKIIFLISLLSVFPIFYSLTYFQTNTLVFILVLGIFTSLYVLPFLPTAKNLRDVSGLKIFIIALVWTGVTVILPFLSSEVELSSLDMEKTLYVVSRFVLVIALIIPFEIRDLKLDQIYIKTLPQVFGVKYTKVLGLALVLISMALLSYVVENTHIYVYIHALVIILVLFSKRHNAFYYTALLVESVPILWFLLKYFIS